MTGAPQAYDWSPPATRIRSAELSAEGLACRRGERLVFAGLDFRLPPGSALLLTGSNGSGKSSLLRLLAGLIQPAGGRVLWGGAPIDRRVDYRDAVHYVGHLDAIKPVLAVHEMLGFWASLRGSLAPDIATALETLGLTEQADYPCRWLSAGQRRRLALARLIATPAPIWLLDEPAATLDRDGEDRLVAVIAEHRRSGGQAVIATHQPIAVPDADTLVMDEFAVAPEFAIEQLW